uniref:Uncharacterized protein n=1 Tax=Arundo donax TaxID=35708 RepID=A0A0A9F380_ARUDO
MALLLSPPLFNP